MKNKEEIMKDSSNFEVAVCDLKPISIEPLIHLIRGQQVIIDSDLASLYNIETKRLKEQVNRNISRFPEDFMFKLTVDEFHILRSQNATSNLRGGARYTPYAFTENGVAMLSSVLHSDVAINTNIQIMRAFTAMRRILSANAQLMQRLSNIEHHQHESDSRIDELFERLNIGVDVKQGIFYEGQIFDAYLFVTKLIKSAKAHINLIDNYIDETILSILDKRNIGVDATIYTHRVSSQLTLDLMRHDTQYTPIKIIQFNKAHDRFLLIDEDVYHFGASLKDLGRKLFAFSRMDFITATDFLKQLNDG